MGKDKRRKKTENMAHVMAARIGLAAGLRRGEVLGLSWEDVNLDTGELHVCHTLCKETGKLKDPKTESGNRVVVLDGQTIADLKRWKAMQST